LTRQRERKGFFKLKHAPHIMMLQRGTEPDGVKKSLHGRAAPLLAATIKRSLSSIQRCFVMSWNEAFFARLAISALAGGILVAVSTYAVERLGGLVGGMIAVLPSYTLVATIAIALDSTEAQLNAAMFAVPFGGCVDALLPSCLFFFSLSPKSRLQSHCRSVPGGVEGRTREACRLLLPLKFKVAVVGNAVCRARCVGYRSLCNCFWCRRAQRGCRRSHHGLCRARVDTRCLVSACLLALPAVCANRKASKALPLLSIMI